MVGAVFCGLAFSTRPWEVYFAQRRATAQQVSAMKTAERKRIEDLQTEAQIDSGIGREELARKLGFRKKGEIPLEQR
jgi:hypothetical protein